MKKLHFLFILTIFSISSAWAQQDALFSQYMFNTMLINPAYTGSREVVSLNALYRKQWVNVPGAPETMTFSVDSPLSNERMGLGVVFFNDKIGDVKNTGAYANYAYRVRLTRNTVLSMGISAGFTNYHADYSDAKYNEDGINNDGAFTSFSKVLPNIGAGLFFNSDKFYAGVSMPHVLNNKLNREQGLSARQYRHLFLMAGYVFTLNHYLKLKPSTLIKQVSGAPIQMDLNANLWIHDRFSIGISYRSLDAPVFLTEIQILDQLRFGYAFDYSHTRIRNYNNGTHEFLLRYEFGYDKGKMLTPRYF